MHRTHAGHGSIWPAETVEARAPDQSSLTPEWIAELRGLAEKATPGPWERVDNAAYALNDEGTNRMYLNVFGGYEIQRRNGISVRTAGAEITANAALIAAMRNALPDLLDAAERADDMAAEIEMLRASEARWIMRLSVVRQITGDGGKMMLDEFAAWFDARWKSLIETEALASRAREDALREAIEICKEADAQDDRDNGAAATGAACNAANAIIALIDKPKGGDANDKSKERTRDPATSPGVITGAIGEAKQVDPDWFWCETDPDESGDSAYQAMFTYRPRLEPVELCTSYVGPRLWGVMSPPLPDADNDEETAHTFDTREAAQAFCDERNAIFNGAALCPSEGADRG